MPELAVFDGHNDALTRDDHALIAIGRAGGDVDLPRMAAGGMRGGMFAVCTPSPKAQFEPVARGDGVFGFPDMEPVALADASAHGTAAAGRLFALDRAGLVRVARAIEDLDAAFENESGPPATVLHLEGAEAIDPELEALDTWYASGLRSLGPVWSRANDFGHGVPFVFPSSPDTGQGLTGAGRRLVGAWA